MANPFKSRRVTTVEDDRPAPTPFETIGGWGPAEHSQGAHAALDPIVSEREQRVAGALALAALNADRLAGAEAAMSRRLGNAPRGRDFTKPWPA